MNSIITTYPGFQSLPRGIKKMLMLSESLFFEDAKALLCLALACSLNAHAVLADETEAINSLMTNLYARGQFNGSIIVARDGKLIYRNAFGEANSESHRQFTPTTPSNIEFKVNPA